LDIFAILLILFEFIRVIRGLTLYLRLFLFVLIRAIRGLLHNLGLNRAYEILKNETV